MREGEGGWRTPAGWGQGESGDGVRGCFCFEMAGFEIRRRTSQLYCQWRTELIDSGTVSPLAILSLFLFCHVQLCFPLLLFCSSCCPSTQMQPTPGSESVSLFQGGGTAGAATTNRKLSKRILTQASWSSFLW